MDRGRLAYIMPLEFLNTGYGAIVKKRLIESGHLVSIINLKCEKDIFPDAITSVGIILYDACCRYSHVDFHIADSISSLENILESRANHQGRIGATQSRVEVVVILPDKYI